MQRRAKKRSRDAGGAGGTKRAVESGEFLDFRLKGVMSE